MEDRYAEAIIDELERIADLLQTLVQLKGAELQEAGLKDLPLPFHRRADERRSAKAKSEPKRARP